MSILSGSAPNLSRGRLRLGEATSGRRFPPQGGSSREGASEAGRPDLSLADARGALGEGPRSGEEHRGSPYEHDAHGEVSETRSDGGEPDRTENGATGDAEHATAPAGIVEHVNARLDEQ